MFTVSFQAAKEGFFDRQKVQAAVDAGARRVLSKFGAFVRQRAKSSIRKRKGISSPGSPPSSHTGLLKRFILFGYDAQRKSVVIGPTLIRSGSQAPRLLEHGGSTTLKTREGRKFARYRPRPFMGPAFVKEQSTLPALWKNSVR